MQQATRYRINVRENKLIPLVRQLSGRQLNTVNGEKVKILYPGRESSTNGPDFQDAVVLINDKRYSGDIEVHVYANDWYRHGHQYNREYNNVVLHIVAQSKKASITHDSTGRSIPLLRLPSHMWLQPRLLAKEALPCSNIGSNLNSSNLASFLMEIGEKRFRQKASHFQSQLQDEEGGQLLYAGIMRALGYTYNTVPFEKLSRLLPLKQLEKLKPSNNVYYKHAQLLGTAGLLSSSSLSTFIPESIALERIIEIWQKSKNRVKLEKHEWNTTQIYPNNSPVRRLLALGYILQHYRLTGLLNGIMQHIVKAVLNTSNSSIEEGLIVHDVAFERRSHDTTIRVESLNTTLLGKSKASQIAVNILLPFAFAWFNQNTDGHMQNTILSYYRSYPPGSSNMITRHMTEQFHVKGYQINNACQQQGLLHLYKNYCRSGNCAGCPVNFEMSSA